MKSIFVFLLVLIVIGSLVLAQSPQLISEAGAGVQEAVQVQAGQEAGQEQQVQTEQQTQNQGEEENLTIQQRQQIRVQAREDVKQVIEVRQQEMNLELERLRGAEEKVYRNQNTVRLAVHSLLAMEDLVGGIGRNVSLIAREFNNSVQATIRAEQRIQKRNILLRLLVGGDEEAAGDIEQEVNRNQPRIQELKQLMPECDCEEEVRTMMLEQIQNMEQEQNRLQQVAQNEKKSKGLFGWLWK
jgi:hypothetical protein